MKTFLGKLATTIIHVGGPILSAALVHKALTGKLDLKGAALDAARDAIDAARPRA